MKNFTQILLEKYDNSFAFLQKEMNIYFKKVSPKLPKSLQLAVTIINDFQITDKELILRIMDSNKADYQLISQEYNWDIDKVKELRSLLKMNKDKLKLLPHFQTPEERKAVVDGQMAQSDILMDLSTEKGRNNVAKQYMPLVRKITNSMLSKTEMDASQVLSAGLEGFTYAMNTYKKPDEQLKNNIDSDGMKKKHQSFAQYAAYMIRFYILNEITNASRMVRIPSTALAKGNVIKTGATISLDKQNSEEDDRDIKDLITGLQEEPDYNIAPENKQWQLIYNELEKKFSSRDMMIFYKTYGLNGYELMKGKEIAKELSVSAPTITVVLNKIIKYIKTDKKLLEIFQDIMSTMMNENLAKLVGLEKNIIIDELHNNEMYIISETLINMKESKWKTRYNNIINNSQFTNLKEFMEEVRNKGELGFEYLDKNYKKYKNEIVEFLNQMQPSENWNRQSDVDILNEIYNMI